MDNQAFEDDTKRKENGSDTISIISEKPIDLVAVETGNLQVPDKDEPSRENWSGKFDFLLSCIGYAVGIGNVWRFPYLCNRNGGGAFLIPYALALALAGLPLFFMELSLGQFGSLGPITIWRCLPLFKGLGYGMVMLTGILCTYYNVIISYAIFYLFASLTSELPWSSCNNTWNTPRCYRASIEDVRSGSVNLTGRVTPSEEYWDRYLLERSDGFHDTGGVRWQLALCLMLSWIIVFASLSKGVKSSGKVVYFTATFPYLVLIILLIRGVTLPGAVDGILYFITPKWKLLLNPQVWVEATVQIFYSLGPAWGGLLTMASYNKFNNNCYRDAIIVSVTNCGTSVFAGFVVFSMLGFMAHSTGQTVDDLSKSGPALAFIAYPEGISRMPYVPPVFAVLFFIMILTLGCDSQFTMMEALISAFVDEYPKLLRAKRTLWTLIICFLMYLIGFPFITRSGIYWFTLVDWYAGVYGLMAIAFLESIGISWIYGFHRFSEDIKLMLGFKPNLYWRVCWQFITPLLMLVIMIFTAVSQTQASYGDYQFPDWAISVGWLIASASVVCIPLVFITQFFFYTDHFSNCSKESLKRLISPTPEWGPAYSDESRRATLEQQTKAMKERKLDPNYTLEKARPLQIENPYIAKPE
ncbi:sodium- and chloride-dependent glycine transporter 2-like [Tubulanus polymorphus]|uniref:sodium- and chloride-dependent glycine transporter 2-like n=1 Tax=Tubulanus polymorphus TaxID=672921 RepID=UPI003DA4F1CC